MANENLTLANLADAFETLANTASDADESDGTAMVTEYAALLRRAGQVAADSQWLGLFEVFGLLSEGLTDDFGQLDYGLSAAVADWPQLLRTYIASPQDEQASMALIEFTQRPCWDADLDYQSAVALLDALREPGAREAGADDQSILDSADDSFAVFDEDSADDSFTAFDADSADDSFAAFDTDSTDDSFAAVDTDSADDSFAIFDADSADDSFAIFDEMEAGDGEASDIDQLATDMLLQSEVDGTDVESDASPAPGEITQWHDLDAAAAAAEFNSLMEVDHESVTTASLSDGIRELLDILIAELPQVEVSLSELLGLLGAADVDSAVKSEAATTTQDLFDRLFAAAETMGLEGLAKACQIVRQNLSQIAAEDVTVSERQIEILRGVMPALRNYLHEPMAAGPVAELLGLLSDTELPEPLDEDAASALSVVLRNPDFGAVEDEFVERVEAATLADVSLEVPEDVSQELLDGLLQEMPQYAEEFSTAIQNLIHGGTMEDVNVAQRVAHTLKGAGNTVGVRGVAELTHHLEDILIALAKHEVLPTRPLAETMMVASDCIEAMAEFLQGSGPEPSDALQVLQQVLDWANRIDREGPPASDTEAPEQTQPASVESVMAEAEALLDSAATKATAEAVVDEREGGTLLRVPSRLVDELLRIVGETIILNSQLHERVRQSRGKAAAMASQFDVLQLLGTELEELVDVKDLSANAARGQDKQEFDALEMDQYNELHTYSRRMIEASIDAREIGRTITDDLVELDDMLVTQARINRETQDGVLETRMVPVKSVFPRLQRSVRQTCRQADKEVELRLVGGDTLMDSDVLREIVDPLMHLLRNSIDHGIEKPAARDAAGKNDIGGIDLEFARDGNNILVRCSDDGAGLDYDAIRAAGEKAGLLDSAADASEDELKRLVLRPNFTTRKKATQTSGRGIGLDAVHGRVAELGGSMLLDSSSGQGCTVEVRLPVTLLSTHALLVRAQDESYALASRGIKQIVHIEEGEIKNFGSETVFQFGDQVHRAQRIEAVLGLETDSDDASSDPRSAVLIEIDNEVQAVLVDTVIGGRELVVKTLGRYLPKLTGIVGATILGDGHVSPVIDLVDMLRSPILAELGTAIRNKQGQEDSDNLPTAVVVDDSISARRALAQLLRDSGFSVQTARDGMEAVELLENHVPDVIFVDMEMPRMDGIELTAHIRASERTAGLPVIMVTSRSTTKHRQQAEHAGVNAYVTKPFAEDQLIEQAQKLMDVA